MGKTIENQKVTANHRDKVVVFMIGMRINKWWAIHKWLPVALAMPKMIKEQYQNPSLGCLAMESFSGLRTTFLLQYWRSEEDLMNYAKGGTHLKAWKEFNQRNANNHAVGIYHETYIVQPNQMESLYVNMPVFGLAKLAGFTPINKHLKSAKQRLHRTSSPS
ncbi:DUF4188 domain-containing protein [Alkalihalobacillus pseudalcaliphilus]|uniref:DUF4188 domain-containing protein n=1 Tax=Alkalihalobacillus pseudalcaliphilus TaxID=79884 RepID=UPI00064D8BE4|nr:DUF4188 domain-containing protein [Alkalihalobacillus pseudalcaliphilus]KMK77575.1 transcriptional regulator [Alkalihalobacillus pseudalcaliphilus]